MGEAGIFIKLNIYPDLLTKVRVFLWLEMELKLRRIKQVYFLLSVLGVFTGMAQAQQQIRFLDIWDLRPLTGVRVCTVGDTVWSDSAGVARLTPALMHAQRVRIDKPGYFPEKIQPEQTIVWLTPIERSEEIVASGKASSTPFSGLPAHISRIEPQDAPAGVTANLAESLKGISGVQIKAYGATGQMQTVSLRGMSAAQTQISLDGVPLNNLQLGSADLGLLDLNALGEVFVYRGGSLYLGGSGTIGGAMNIHPAKLSDYLTYRLFYERASWNNETFGAHLQLPVKGLRQQISFFRAYGTNDYSALKPHQAVPLQNRDFSRWNGQYQSRYDFSERLSASLLLLQTRNKRGAPKPFTSAQAEQVNRARMDTDQNLSKAKVVYAAPNSGLTLQVYDRNEWMRYHDPAVVLNNRPLHSLHFNQELGIQIRGHIRPLTGLNVVTGASVASYKIKSTDAGLHRRTVQSVYTLSVYDYSFEETWIKSLQLRPGVRVERIKNNDWVWLPGLGVSLQGAAGEAYVSAGRNFRRPTLNDLYWTPGGNPDLQAETSWNYEAGLKHWRQTGVFLWQMQAAVYRNEVRGQIRWLPQNGIWRPQNLTAVRSEGVEFSAEIAHINNRHALRAGYTFGTAEKSAADFPGDQTVGHRLPYTPRESWNVRAKTGYGWLDGGFLYTGNSFAFVGIANDPADIIPAYRTLDVWAAVTFPLLKQIIRFRLAARNLFNERYESVKGYPMPPRNFRFSVELRPKK